MEDLLNGFNDGLHASSGVGGGPSSIELMMKTTSIIKEEFEKLAYDKAFILKVYSNYIGNTPIEELEEWKREMLTESCENWLDAIVKSL